MSEVLRLLSTLHEELLRQVSQHIKVVFKRCRAQPKARASERQEQPPLEPEAELHRTAESSESDVDEHQSRLAVTFADMQFP